MATWYHGAMSLAHFLFSTLVFLLAMAGMSVGVLLRRPPIKGSCGGLQQLGNQGGCELCGWEGTQEGRPAVAGIKARDATLAPSSVD